MLRQKGTSTELDTLHGPDVTTIHVNITDHIMSLAKEWTANWMTRIRQHEPPWLTTKSIKLQQKGRKSIQNLTRKLPITTIVICFVICLWFWKSFLQTVWTQNRLLLKEQSDLGPHCLPVCKNRFEKFARLFSRRRKQTTFSDAGFLGALRVKGTNL